MAGGWRLPPLRCEWCAWTRRQPPRRWWAACCLGRAPGAAGHSPWDEISASVWAVPLAPACMLRGWYARDGDGVAAGHMPSLCSLLPEGSCLPGTFGRGCMYMNVDIVNVHEGGHMHKRLCPSLRFLVEREKARARLSSFCHFPTRLCASQQQHGCGTARGECATHKRCLSPWSRPHPQGSGSLPFRDCPGGLLLCRALRV